MATSAPLLGAEKKKGGHSKASIFYGADEYLEELKRKYAHDHEIAALKNLLPGEADPNAAGVAASQDKMLTVEKNNENRSLKTNRLFPTANKPDPMPQNLAFLFTKITPEQMIYMKWNVLTAIFVTQVLMIIGYCAALATFPEYWWTCTLLFGVPFSYIAIQQIYIDHDVMHGATFPVYDFQKFLTHPFADFFSLPWEEFVRAYEYLTWLLKQRTGSVYVDTSNRALFRILEPSHSPESERGGDDDRYASAPRRRRDAPLPGTGEIMQLSASRSDGEGSGGEWWISMGLRNKAVPEDKAALPHLQS
eukprot:Skav233329  [mRNA]  locus=scaffold2479:20908:26487:- [translate_table: standard]